jgi:hypothetical protein
MLPNEAMEPTLPIDRIDPREPIESSESLEPIDSSELRDHNDQRKAFLAAAEGREARIRHYGTRWERWRSRRGRC